MKNTFLLMLTFTCYCLFLSGKTYSQINGTKTIPGDYPTIAAALTDLNGNGVGPGGVTYNIAAGYTETITATLSLIVSGTQNSPIVFQKNGTGANPKIIAYSGGTASTYSDIQDGIWCFVGTDYITIDGIDLFDPNITYPETMEYGYGFYKINTTNGCQNNTIKNCVITLNRDNNNYAPWGLNGSRAINFINSNPNYQITMLDIISASGSNSYNKFYNNTLQNCSVGIALVGFNTTNPLYADTGNDIGGTSSSTANTIINFGGGPGGEMVSGVSTSYQWGCNISYNTINNNDGNGANHLGSVCGIIDQDDKDMTISNNHISIHGGAVTHTIYGISFSSSDYITASVTMTNNTITGDYPTSTGAFFYPIYYYCENPAFTANIISNTISGVSCSGSGSIVCISCQSMYPSVINCSNNIIDSITMNGNGTIEGIIISGTTVMNTNNNTINNLRCTSAVPGSEQIFGIFTGSGDKEYIMNNTLTNFYTAGFSTIKGIANVSPSGNKIVQNNNIHSFYTDGGGEIYGISMLNGDLDSIDYNRVYDFNAVGNTGTIYGIYYGSGSANVIIHKNEIFDLSHSYTDSHVNGLTLLAGSNNYVNNNIIGNLYAPLSNQENAISGINIGGGVSNYVYYNTVYINAVCTAPLFGTSAFYTVTSPTLFLINNIFVNTSIPNGTGHTVAYQRSNSTLNMYHISSNNNFYYSGTPSASRLIYYDGTIAAQTLYLFKTFVAPCDSASKTSTSVPSFLSITGSNANYLHIDGSVPSAIESGGKIISTYNDDFDGNIRSGSPGYPVQIFAGGTMPDIGADEFDGYPFIYTGLTENPSGNFSLYPNPASCYLYVDGPTNIASAEVFDISGNLIRTKQLSTSQIDISSLAKGLYFIRLTNYEGSVVSKFIKE